MWRRPADLRKLRSNGTDKLLLVNFWAIGSGSAASALADLETTYQMYRGRDFDLVSVSTNTPDEKQQVLAVLQQQHASSRNLILGPGESGALQAAFKGWQSGVPYTVLISPDGKIVFEKQGKLDILKLRRTILANMPGDYVGFQKYWITN